MISMTHTESSGPVAPAQATAGNTHGQQTPPPCILCTHTHTLTTHNFICAAATLGQRNVWAGAPLQRGRSTKHSPHCLHRRQTLSAWFEKETNTVVSGGESGWWEFFFFSNYPFLDFFFGSQKAELKLRMDFHNVSPFTPHWGRWSPHSALFRFYIKSWSRISHTVNVAYIWFGPFLLVV